MGHYAAPSHGITTQYQNFYLHTGGDPQHFSSYRYKVSLALVGKKQTSGKIFISLFSDHISTPEYEVKEGKLHPGNKYSGFIDSHVELDEVNCVDFRWTPLALQSNALGILLGAERVNVQSGEDGKVLSFCSSGAVLHNVTLTLGPCTAYTQSRYLRSHYRDWL
ncbi:pancreatic triacylglycerol lipase-like [Pyxicephalus adspersus]|uniref:pancreatic triacylglycerol lipase-like n=1 Tax=Pyxicephalus adspersus TaxID=30357 RepID=UPI003B5B86FC